MLNLNFDIYKNAMETLNNALMDKWSVEKKTVELSFDLHQVVKYDYREGEDLDNIDTADFSEAEWKAHQSRRRAQKLNHDAYIHLLHMLLRHWIDAQKNLSAYYSLDSDGICISIKTSGAKPAFASVKLCVEYIRLVRLWTKEVRGLQRLTAELWADFDNGKSSFPPSFFRVSINSMHLPHAERERLCAP